MVKHSWAECSVVAGKHLLATFRIREDDGEEHVDERALHDARLAAAAPELLEALEALLDSVDAREERPDCWCTSSGNEEPRGSIDIRCGACRARAAIAHARGPQ